MSMNCPAESTITTITLSIRLTVVLTTRQPGDHGDMAGTLMPHPIAPRPQRRVYTQRCSRIPPPCPRFLSSHFNTRVPFTTLTVQSLEVGSTYYKAVRVGQYLL